MFPPIGVTSGTLGAQRADVADCEQMQPAVNVLHLCRVGQCCPTGKQCKVRMEKYDIQHLSNAQGKGFCRPYVLLTQHHLSPIAELEAMTEHNTTQTRAGMKATVPVVAEFVETQLATENNLYPMISWRQSPVW